MKGLPATVDGGRSLVGTIARAFLNPARRQIVGFGIDTAEVHLARARWR